MTDTEWEAWGYPSLQPCEVCGKQGSCRSEPRFGYVVCRDHANVPPTEIQEKKK